GSAADPRIRRGRAARHTHGCRTENVTMSAPLSTGDAGALLERELAGQYPDARGRYGPYGGRYVPETLVPALDRLEVGVRRWLADPAFRAELDAELATWVG